MKKIALIAILSGISLAIAVIFWYQEMQYLMPTPVPHVRQANGLIF